MLHNNELLNTVVLHDKITQAEKRQNEQLDNLDILSPNTAWIRLPLRRKREDNRR